MEPALDMDVVQYVGDDVKQNSAEGVFEYEQAIEHP